MPHAKGEGPCSFHDEGAQSALSLAKEQFLKLYGTGKVTLSAAAEVACGIDVRTLQRWRKEDEIFDAAVRALLEEVDGVNAIEVEENWIDRLKRGEGSAAETFFYLVNRSRGRWRHLVQYQAPKDISELTDEELEALRHGRAPQT